MKTKEEILDQLIDEIYEKFPNESYSDFDIAEHVYDNCQPQWIPVSGGMPPFNTLILLRGVIDWRDKDAVSYFSDEVQNDYEILEYGRSGYLLKNNSDYLVVPVPNPEEVCSEYITHWMPLPQPPKED